ncbi:MAG: UvrD-helicase domain-containing protein [Clostridia bacterium]|nr:UvrD-helicase domain-containing protein [Clostridia bacterium]
MPEWTREQRAAIDARNHTILVSAAAGSGKTAVLIERIVTLLREGARLDRMMICTFTRAAAAEMRERLNKRLTDEAATQPELMGRALDELEGAEISTIHSFCQRMLREEFQAAGIDPLASICEEQKRVAMFREAYTAAFNELLEEQHPDVLLLSEAVDQKIIEEWNQRLFTFLMALPNPFRWLEEQIDSLTREPFTEQPWYKTVQRYVIQQAEGMGDILQREQLMLRQPFALNERFADWDNDVYMYQTFREHLTDHPEELPMLLQCYSFATLKRLKGAKDLSEEQQAWDKGYKKLRDQHKKLVKELLELIKPDEERWRIELPNVQAQMRGLAALVKRTEKHFSALKRQANVLDFNDLEQMTLGMLEDAVIREKLQERFDHIFVDECQDVSAVQDAIIQQLHGEHCCLFMVGDVKQSIYRFRQADPTLFLHRMRTFADNEDARERRIFLQKNFRSRPAVLEATNRVFRKVMRADVTELDYLPEDELIPGRSCEFGPSVELLLLEGAEEATAAETLELQADQAAARIRELLKESFHDGKQVRHYTYRDIVILMPSVARQGSLTADMLQARGIPVYYDGADDYFALPEILAVTNLLSLIDNAQQDVPLLSVLKMTPFLMTDQQLADIRLCKSGRNVPFHEAFAVCCEGEGELAEICRTVRGKIEGWQFLSKVLPLSDFLWRLMRETGMLAVSGALPEGEIRQANLMLMCQRAAEYEDNGGVSLSGFLREMTNMRAAGDSRSAKVLGEGEDLVRIMTIHKSKGLEFPVVFVMGMGSALHLSGGKSLRMHSRLGCCVPYVNREMNIRRDTILDKAFDIQRKLDEKAERARVLYVAMTRAREQMILLCGDVSRELEWRAPEGAFRVWQAKSMADWVMQTVCDKYDAALSTDSPQVATPWRIRVTGIHDQQVVEKVNVIHNMQDYIASVLSAPPSRSTFAAWESRPAAQAMPLKTSVSSLVRQEVLRDPMPLTDAEETADDKTLPEEIVSPLRLSELPRLPSFMEQREMTGAEAGTLTHRALSMVSLEAMRGAASLTETLWVELCELTDRGCFTSQERLAVKPNAIVNFFRSDMGQRLLRSPEVKREWHFNLRLQEMGDVLLQGVID